MTEQDIPQGETVPPPPTDEPDVPDTDEPDDEDDDTPEKQDQQVG